MKKTFTAILLILTVAVSAVMFSACAEDVKGEADLYGSFLTEDNTRSITLAEDHAAVVCYGENAESYYARYDLMNEKIELRVDGFRGNIAYTLRVVDVDMLDLVFTPQYADADKPAEEQTIRFVRDKSYDPTV